jgi:opacity protein-like surface antigen
MRRRVLVRRLAWLAATAPLLATAPALAQDEIEWDYARRGFYGTAFGSFAFGFFQSDLSDRLGTRIIPADSDRISSLTSWGAGGALGYRLLPNLGLELAGEWLNDFTTKYAADSTVGTPPPGPVYGDTEWFRGDRATGTTLWNVTANAKGFVLTGRFQPYGLLGIGYGQAKTAPVESTSWIDRGFVMRFGIGTNLMVTEEVGLNLGAAYLLPTGDLSDFDYFTLNFGFLVRFLPL